MKNLGTVELMQNYWALKSRESFLAFRVYMHYPNFLRGWFVDEISNALQDFYDQYVAGLKPIYIIEAPPQHGKSSAVTDFICWMFGKRPESRVFFASFSDRLGVRTNRLVQRAFESTKFRNVFPGDMIGAKNIVTMPMQPLRNSTCLEMANGVGFFRNTTVEGAVNGESLDIGVIDDAIKGRKESNSKVVRESTWDWLTDDFYARFSEYGALLMINTRWHVDDPAGRMQDHAGDKNVRVIKYPAIATHDEKYRNEGDPLFPEFKSLDFLLDRKSTMLPDNWESVYQQSPRVAGGGLFRDTDWRWYTELPELRYKFITVDSAQKLNKWNDYTDFMCWGVGVDNNIYLIDHFHDRIEAPELRKDAAVFYAKHDNVRKKKTDAVLRFMAIEDKSSGIGLIQELRKKRMKIVSIPRTVDKGERAADTAPYVRAGRVYLNKGVHKVDRIVEEGRDFPNGVHDDAIDNVMNAIEVAFINDMSTVNAINAIRG